MLNKCDNFTGVTYAIDGNRKLIAPLRCKMWTCPYCAEKNRSIWRASIIHNINKLMDKKDLTQWSFLTLTSHEEMRGHDASYKVLSSGWKRLYDRIRRKYGPLEFIRVYEQHEDSTLHLHFIISNHVSKKWLKDNARECGMGYMADARHIEGHAGYVAAYITKYMTKALEDFPRGFRRVQGSRGFTLRKNAESEIEWIFKGKYTGSELWDDLNMYDEVYNVSENKIMTSDDLI